MSPKATLLIADSIFRGFDGENFRHRDFKNFINWGSHHFEYIFLPINLAKKLAFLSREEMKFTHSFTPGSQLTS